MKIGQIEYVLVILLSVAVCGCRKKVVAPAPTPAPEAKEQSARSPEPEPAAAEPSPAPSSSETAPAPDVPQRSFAQELQSRVADAYFDFNRFEVRGDAREMLAQNATVLRELFDLFPTDIVKVEGHADERGSAEFNLALADKRATAAKEFLSNLGVPPERISTISYGKERPQCFERSEECWQRNRRAHFVHE